MSRRSFFTSCIILFCSLFSIQVLAESLTISSAINKAGRQRMLTQNILKNHLLLGLNVNVLEARQELDKSVALFESQFQELSNYAPTHTIQISLGKVERLWMAYRTVAIRKVTRDTVATMLDTNNAILRASHQVVMDLQGFAGRQSAELVNVSGRQRMLSQRIAAYYFAQAMGFDSELYQQEFKRAQKEYAKGLARLTAYQQNTPALDKALKKVNAQWNFSKVGFAESDSGYYVPHVISVTTSGMLKRMESITQQYEELDSRLSRGAAVAVRDTRF